VTVTLLAVAAALAVGDWAAVQFPDAQIPWRLFGRVRELRVGALEYLLKPGALAVLLAAACVADLGGAKYWVVAALAFGLAGDVGLMLSEEGRTDLPFLAGLGAFLAGHVCYVVAFARTGLRGWDVFAGVLVVAGVAGLALPQVLRGAARASGRLFAGIIAGYATLLAAMAVLGIGTGIVATAIGAVLFLCSDTLLARNRFVAPVRSGPLLVIVTYHAAQFLILIGLLYRS